MAEDNIISLEERYAKVKAERERLLKEKEEGLILTDEQKAARAAEIEPLLLEMNAAHGFIEYYGGSPAVSIRVYDAYLERYIIKFVSPNAFAHVYSHKPSPMTGEKGVVKPLGKWWLEQPHRKTYSTVTFEPDKPIKEYKKDDKLILNLWEGFSVEPKPGCWRRTLKHIYTVLCNSEREKFNYVIRWFAWAVQNPHRQAEVALVFKGQKGAGKNTILSRFKDLFGRHGVVVSDIARLTGKHNSYLEMTSFLFADEAYTPGNYAAEGIIKSLITEDSLAVDPKFRDLAICRNRLHIVMATNNDWVVPATIDERRYFINEVNGKYAKGNTSDNERQAYFDKLWAELGPDGLSAMLHDLQKLDLKGWHPRMSVPRTKELVKQIMLSLPHVKTAMFYMLEEGAFPGERQEIGYIVTNTVLLNYLKSLDESSFKNLSAKGLSNILKELELTQIRTKDHRYWLFPELHELRGRWDKKIVVASWDNEKVWKIPKTNY